MISQCDDDDIIHTHIHIYLHIKNIRDFIKKILAYASEWVRWMNKNIKINMKKNKQTNK